MEMFGRASFSQSGFAKPVAIRPTMGQIAGPSARTVIERMRSVQNRYSDLLSRNEALTRLPQDYAVRGYFEQNLRDTADKILNKWIAAIDRRPTQPYWDDQASADLKNDAEAFNNDVTKFEGLVTQAEAKAGVNMPEPTTPGGQPGAVPTGITKAGMLPPTGMLVLGLIAVGSFLGAVLLGADHSGFMMAGRKR